MTKTTNKTHDMGNNETLSTGVFKKRDGTYVALTFTRSKSFKTRRGAAAWYKRETTWGQVAA